MLLYADEDFAFPAVEELRVRGHDVLTAQEDGQTAMPDAVILARAFALGERPRILVHPPLGLGDPLGFGRIGRSPPSCALSPRICGNS